MKKPDAKQIQQLLKSEQFDAEWYLRTYPDVVALGMNPAEHYLLYGQVMSRDPAPGVSIRFMRTAYGIRPDQEPIARLKLLEAKNGGSFETNPRKVLMAANNVALAGDHERAIALADAHLIPDLAYTANILRANAALVQTDETAWQHHLNSYLKHFDVAPIKLQGTGSIFDRLACDPLPEVTGGPLISVIMPAWNAEKMVRKAALSILNQTWRNLELLIVDDCSTDGTWAVLQQIAASDSRVKIMRNKVNVGPYVSKNIALMQAKGEWMTGHDADDWAHPQRLEKHMNYLILAEGRIPASRAYMLRIDTTGRFAGISLATSEKIDGVFQRCGISTIYQMAFFRENIGAYDCARFGADNELVSRIQLTTGRDIDEFRNLSMICQSIEGSLTNNSVFGVGGQYGVTPGRKAYKSAWQEAHTALGPGKWTRYVFPPNNSKLISAPFNKPQVANVPTEAILSALPSDIISIDSIEDLVQLGRSYQKELRNIVFVATDLSTIGGLPNRTRIVLSHAIGRKVVFQGLTRRNEFNRNISKVYCLADHPDEVLAKLSEWSPSDTVFVVSNNVMKPFPAEIVQRIKQFPIVYFSAAQLAFFIQNSHVLMDLEYVERFRATKIISLSDGDIRFQQQLGIFGQIKGTVPVAQRKANTYDPLRNHRLGYVGRIDFHAKDCMRLLDVARAMKGLPSMPMKVFTTDGKNSPEYTQFRSAIAEAGLADQFEFVVNCTDKDQIYSEIGCLLLPSKMEGFGNVVVEAFSYGIPVIAASYAPGPADTIEHEKSGILLDTYTGEAVRTIYDKMKPQGWQQMSQAAFERHKRFSLEEHVCLMERVCAEALNEFQGENKVRVFPVLELAKVGQKKLSQTTRPNERG